MKNKKTVQLLILCALLLLFQAAPLLAETPPDPPPQFIEDVSGVIERIGADSAITINGEIYYPSPNGVERKANPQVGERAMLLYTTDQKGIKTYFQVTRAN